MAFSDDYTAQAAALDTYFARSPDAARGEGPVLIFRAVTGTYLDRLGRRPVQGYQTHQPEADLLAAQGVATVAEPEPPAALAIVFATKHKEETLYHYARAAECLDEGGRLIGVAPNELGAASLEKRCAELLGGIETFSKHKCRVFSGTKDSARLNGELLAEWRRLGDWQAIPGTDLVSRPGLFSSKAVDPGTLLLARHLPDDFSGRGADLGAGYGVLSRAVLSRCRGVTEFHLVEAERKALDAAARNLAGYPGPAALHYHWADATAGLPFGRLDFVVMNPPFHTGRGARPGLGRAFIRVALAALRPGGRLWLVANRHLSYEDELAELGATGRRVAEEGGFKVIKAAKS
jgi:16S rRNA (guanine1207-N2)-methyltransferase